MPYLRGHEIKFRELWKIIDEKEDVGRSEQKRSVKCEDDSV